MTGVTIGIHATTRCNLSCHYCSTDLNAMNEKPIFRKELTANEWLSLIDKFSKDGKRKVTLVQFAGGEPAVYKDIAPLINGLIKRKIAVRIHSNLLLKRFLPIKKSPYVRIVATYHPSGNLEKFLENLKMYRKRFMVVTKEIKSISNVLEDSFLQTLQIKADEPSRMTKGILFVPDGRRVDTCYAEGFLADNYKPSRKVI